MATSIGRRQFISALAGATVAWPTAGNAQQPTKLPTIGFLGTITPAAQRLWLNAFLQRLRELGWIEGRTVTIEYRWAEGSSDRAAEIAAEFVRLKVDVIVTYANPMVFAAKHATSVIPIIFAAAADPLGTGLVASFPYSVDLRERVVAAVETGGMSCRRAAAQFSMGISTAINWVRRFRDPAALRRARWAATGRSRFRATSCLAAGAVQEQDSRCAGWWPHLPSAA